MAYPARPRQSARIVTTNVEESAEAEVADRVTVKAKGRIVHCLTRQSVYLEILLLGVLPDSNISENNRNKTQEGETRRPKSKSGC